MRDFVNKKGITVITSDIRLTPSVLSTVSARGCPDKALTLGRKAL